MEDESSRAEEKRHPIQVVSRRTGLTPEVLRIWEKRYAVVEPERTPTGRRLYSDLDIERLRLLRQATLMGRRIGTVASLGHVDLAALIKEDQQAQRDAPAPSKEAPPSPDASEFLDECVKAVIGLDSPRLEVALSRAAVALSSPALIEDLLAPLARTIGEMWAEGRLGPYHEHLATALIRRTVGDMLKATPLNGAPAIVVSSPAGQRHEIGAILAAAAALGQGWRAYYLGPDLPAGDIARAVEEVGAAAVALSIVYPPDDPAVVNELDELRARLPEGVAILVGGAAAPSYAVAITRIGGRLLTDTQTLRLALAEIEAER